MVTAKNYLMGLLGRNLALLMILLAATSCTTEWKLARKYLDAHKGDAIMVSPPTFLYNLNAGARMDVSAYPLPQQQDSVAYYSSNYIQFISDSVFLTLFTNSMIVGLEQMGYQVYVDQASNLFLGSDRPTWIIQLTQLQMEEDYAPAFVSGFDDEGYEYIQEYRINSISLNSWIEVNQVNVENSRQLLYLSGYIQDDTSGQPSLDYFRGNFYFSNPNDSLSFDDIYKMASASGRKHAELLFDYFLNDYVRQQMPANEKRKRYFHYNRLLRRLEEGGKEQFINLKDFQ